MRAGRRWPHCPSAILGAALALGACSAVGDPIEAIGGRAPAPDEFMVLPRKPLVVPPTLAAGPDLPAPDPGRPSPLEPDPEAAAVAALTGDATTARTAAGEVSAGEASLLTAARASSASPEIRVQLEEERIAAAEAEADAPYEPPTLGEMFFGSSDDEEAPDPEIVLDPIAESQRLQREGVATPNDPLARVPEEEAPRPRVQSQYDTTRDRRPTPPIVGQGRTPAFE